MRPQYPLFQSHLDLSHSYWKLIVQSGDIVIDATCGNGHDTLILATLALKEGGGFLYGFDIQEKAIENTKARLEKHVRPCLMKNTLLIHGSHAEFLPQIKKESVKLIVYNLGYLPGADKSLTTLNSTTLQSINRAMDLILPGGLISITCYPGHREGEIEEEALIQMTKHLPPQKWNCCLHRFLNREKAPSLLILQKANP